jgi:hypothetical protein
VLVDQTANTDTWVKHLLARNFRRPRVLNRGDSNAVTDVSNRSVSICNPFVDYLKAEPWPEVLKVFGKGADRVMMSLLLSCGIFTKLDDNGNYSQVSGEC